MKDNKIYFVSSDIHSFCDEWMLALSNVGFEKNNSNHILIICGDIFDRGPKSYEVYKFIKSLPPERRILIKGNHEQIILNIVDVFNYYKSKMIIPPPFSLGYFDRSDFSNGTVGTLIQLYNHVHNKAFKINNIYDFLDFSTQETVIEWFKKSKIYKWLKSDEWINYFELDNYIFVHSFIPLHNKTDISMYDQFGNYKLEYFNDWRTNTTEQEWEDSRWGCPWMQFRDGYFNEEIKNNKILVCGHWHTKDFYQNLDSDFEKQDCPIYNKNNLIGLDTCTALTKRVNILVIKK